MNNVIIVEGAKRTGKSYLLGKLDVPTFKIPFVDYFHGVMGKEGERGEANRDVHWLNAGCDLAVLSLAKSGNLKGLVIDRGPVSNIVFAVMQNRITEDEGLVHLDWLADNGYFDDIHLVLVKAGVNVPERNKDAWEVLDPKVEASLLERYMDRLSVGWSLDVKKITNNYDGKSIERFKGLINGLI